GYGAGLGTPIGALTLSGDIAIVADSVTLQGGSGADAYAQIGNGGFQAAASATSSGGIVIGGAIRVSASGGNVALTGGTSGNSYAQIGQGGAQAAAGAIATTGGISIGGDIAVAMSGGTLSLTDGSSYAAIGNGDSSLPSNSNVSGDIAIEAPAEMSLTASVPAGAIIGNMLGAGTGSGSAVLSAGTISSSSGVRPGEYDIQNDLAYGDVEIDVLDGSLAIESPLSGRGNLFLLASGALSTPRDSGGPSIDTAGDVTLIGGSVTLNGTVSGRDVVVGGVGDTTSISTRAITANADGGSILLLTENNGTINLGGPLATNNGAIEILAGVTGTSTTGRSTVSENCSCTPISTGGGDLLIAAQGPSGSINFADPLTLTGPTTIEAATINVQTINPNGYSLTEAEANPNLPPSPPQGTVPQTTVNDASTSLQTLSPTSTLPGSYNGPLPPPNEEDVSLTPTQILIPSPPFFAPVTVSVLPPPGISTFMLFNIGSGGPSAGGLT
ncbi:MAG: hypothetical protein ACREFQ_08355, partial [Stellaceae bacterium]